MTYFWVRNGWILDKLATCIIVLRISDVTSISNPGLRRILIIWHKSEILDETYAIPSGSSQKLCSRNNDKNYEIMQHYMCDILTTLPMPQSWDMCSLSCFVIIDTNREQVAKLMSDKHLKGGML